MLYCRYIFVSLVLRTNNTKVRGPLTISAADGIVAVAFHSGVCVWRRADQTAYLHAIVHPVMEAKDIRMITSVLVKNSEQLLFGTALGCYWNVHPTQPQEEPHQFRAFSKMLPIRLLRTISVVDEHHLDGQTVTVVGAGTVSEIFIIPPDGDFTRCLVAPRPLDFAMHGQRVYVLSKYGSVYIYNLLDPKGTRSVPPPADTCAVHLVTPWYPALHISDNERLLSVYYPDGLVQTYTRTATDD